MHILHRARAIVDHVVACRDEGMVSRQAAVAAILCGCELGDRSLSRNILHFCPVQNERTRYHMFTHYHPLAGGGMSGARGQGLRERVVGGKS